MQCTTTIAAYDLGQVRGPNAGWRSFAFDLRTIQGPIEAGVMRVHPGATPPGILRFGEGGSGELNLTASAVTRQRDPDLQFGLNEEALSLANLAVGGFLYLDAWLQTSDGCAPACVAGLRLEVRRTAAARELAA